MSTQIEDLIKLEQTDLPLRFYQTNTITQEGRAFFPYPDYWRGSYTCDKPIVVEREAGFRPRVEKPKLVHDGTGHAYPDHCFEASPRTRYPCYPECTEPFKYYNRFLMNSAKIYLYR